MIGSFGEVYVLDWGLALDLRHRPPAGTTRAMLYGTPAYMAPEMAGGDVGLLDTRTDVFLLGALLHELLTGRPRHVGQSVPALLMAAYRPAPVPYGPWIPAELGAIANRATSRDPADRHPSAEAFRKDIESYIGDRSALCDASTTTPTRGWEDGPGPGPPWPWSGC
jgi:serine/threonine-protein kinase